MKCLLIKTTSYRRFLSNRLVGITAKKTGLQNPGFHKESKYAGCPET